jgi:hypothetical protein
MPFETDWLKVRHDLEEAGIPANQQEMVRKEWVATYSKLPGSPSIDEIESMSRETPSNEIVRGLEFPGQLIKNVLVKPIAPMLGISKLPNEPEFKSTLGAITSPYIHAYNYLRGWESRYEAPGGLLTDVAFDPLTYVGGGLGKGLTKKVGGFLTKARRLPTLGKVEEVVTKISPARLKKAEQLMSELGGGSREGLEPLIKKEVEIAESKLPWEKPKVLGPFRKPGTKPPLRTKPWWERPGVKTTREVMESPAEVASQDPAKLLADIEETLKGAGD